jgi:hypothetical protein
VSDQIVIHIPASYTAAQTSDLAAANAGVSLVLIKPDPPAPLAVAGAPAPAAAAVPSHRDFWLGLIGVLKMAADAALPIVIPAFGGAAAKLLDIGIDDAKAAILADPVTEHWTAEMLAAKQASVVGPKT